jgi:hypothetical protein
MATNPTGPNPANIVYTTYTAAGIVFAKANEANLATAKKLNVSADSLTEVFNPVTLATGKITATSGNTTITGVSTSFLTDFSVGDYMFYYTANATPTLLGKVSAVNSDTSITLASGSPVTITNAAYCGKTNTVIGVNESVLMRIPVVPVTNQQVAMPNWNAYRQQSGVPTSYNIASRSSMETYSEVNNPTVATGSPINIDYTITPIDDYAKVTVNGFQYVFATSALFPNYAYAILNPYGDSSVDSLPSNTLYKMFASETFTNNGILVTTNYPLLFLQTAGY